jgi:rubrerythrin
VFTISEILDLAVQVEKNGEQTYREARVKMADPSVASMLEWLAGEEAEHAESFSRLREEIKESPVHTDLDEMAKRILRDVLGDQSFSLKEADFSKIEDIESLLKLALEFERDTVLFYEMLQAFLGEEDKETRASLDGIIAEERAHIQALETFLQDKQAVTS